MLTSQIIFRQRGTLWYPGQNAGLGRDHTIYALTSGFVRYYRDPLRHPKRRYIGVVFDKEEKLPKAPGAARRRRLELRPVPRPAEEVEMDDLSQEGKVEEVGANKAASAELTLRPGGMYRQANWEIGRVEKKGGREVRPFVKGDRFKAWRKTVRRKEKNAEKKVGMGRKVAGKRKK